MLAIVSVGIANLLILQRVVILWDHRPVRLLSATETRSATHCACAIHEKIVLKVMMFGFLISFAAQVATMVFALVDLLREPQFYCFRRACPPQR